MLHGKENYISKDILGETRAEHDSLDLLHRSIFLLHLFSHPLILSKFLSLLYMPEKFYPPHKFDANTMAKIDAKCQKEDEKDLLERVK